MLFKVLIKFFNTKIFILKSWIGDGYCDLACNVSTCDYDGGFLLFLVNNSFFKGDCANYTGPTTNNWWRNDNYPGKYILLLYTYLFNKYLLKYGIKKGNYFNHKYIFFIKNILNI